MLEMRQPHVQDAGHAAQVGARKPGQLGQRGVGRRHMRSSYGPVPSVKSDVADELHLQRPPTPRGGAVVT